MKKDTLRFPLYILFVLMPVLTALVICLAYGVRLTDAVPVFNDEISWYGQVRSAAAYGAPLGYYGYNGSHAAIGTFGPWGPLMVYALSAIPAVRGMTLLTPVLTNLAASCLANLLFLALTRPSFRGALRLVLVSCLTYVSFTYVLTGMSESVRFSMGVILTGILWHLWENAKKGGRFYSLLLYLIAPLFILFATGCYILFAIALPVWFLCLARRISLRSRKKGLFFWILFWILAFLVSLVLVGGVFYLRGRTASAYTTSTTGSLLATLGDGPGAALAFLKGRIKDAWKVISPLVLIRDWNYHHGYYMCFLVTYYLVILLLAVRLLLCIRKTYRDRASFPRYLAAFLLLSGFLAAFVLLYTTVLPTLVRGLNIGFVSAVWLLCLGEDSERIIERRIALLMLAGMISFAFNYPETILPGRFDPAVKESLAADQDLFETWIRVEKGADPWDNTVALYGSMTNRFTGLPAGCGVNAMLDGTPVKQAGYAVLNLEKTNGIDMEKEAVSLAENGYRELYRDEGLVILSRIR